jgi:antitoxin YefM
VDSYLVQDGVSAHDGGRCDSTVRPKTTADGGMCCTAKVLSLAEAKDKLSAVVNDVTSTHQHYTITRNGKPVAVVLPIDDLEALEETIFWLEREMARLRSGEPASDAAEGGDVTGEEMAELMSRRRREAGAA